MANISQRGEPQNESIVLRCTKSDKENLRLIAGREGSTISAIVKQCLIRQGVIQPVYWTQMQPFKDRYFAYKSTVFNKEYFDAVEVDAPDRTPVTQNYKSQPPYQARNLMQQSLEIHQKKLEDNDRRS